MKQAASRRSILAAGLLLGLSALVVAVTMHRVALRVTAPSPSLDFYGLVIDEAGRPVAGADVTVFVDWAEVVSLQLIAPGDRTDAPPKRSLQRRTDGEGRFEVRGEAGNRLEVVDVRAPGTTWLIDYAWVPSSRYAVDDNRIYLYTPRQSYLPDAARPAIFPLIREGASVVPPTSRGGSERRADGSKVTNAPWTTLIPSAGPDASRTAIGVEHRVVELFNGPTTRD